MALPRYRPDIVNRQHPYNWDLAAWWLALPNVVGGSRLIDLMGLNPGTLTNMDSASGWRPSTRPGGFAHLKFDGSNDYVNIGASAPRLRQLLPLTISAWIYQTGTGICPVYSAYSFVTGGSIWNTLRIDTGTLTYFTSNASNTTYQSLAGPVITSNVWTHITVVASGSIASPVITFYVNGVLSSSGAMAAFTTTPDVTVPIYIGGDNAGAGTERFTGNIDDVAIRNSARSARDVRGIYDLSRIGYPGMLKQDVQIYGQSAVVASGVFTEPYQRMMMGV